MVNYCLLSSGPSVHACSCCLLVFPNLLYCSSCLQPTVLKVEWTPGSYRLPEIGRFPHPRDFSKSLQIWDHFLITFLLTFGPPWALIFDSKSASRGIQNHASFHTPSRHLPDPFSTNFRSPKLTTFQDNSNQKRHSPLIASRRQNPCKNHSFPSSKQLLAHHFFTQNWSPREPKHNIKTAS